MKTVKFEVVEVTGSLGSYFVVSAIQQGIDRQDKCFESTHRVVFAENGTDFLSKSDATYFVDLMNDGLKYRGEFKEKEEKKK